MEVVLDGKVLLDRKAEGGIWPGLDRVRAINKVIRERLAALAPVS